MAWEKTALDLAAAAGIGVPANQLVSIAGRDVLIVDRFDRPASGGRIGYLSAMTALEAADGEAWSLSPAFDINPNPSPGRKDLSTAINDDTRADLSDLLGVASLFRLDSDRSLAVLRQVHASVR